jgi:hypothetical protein
MWIGHYCVYLRQRNVGESVQLQIVVNQCFGCDAAAGGGVAQDRCRDLGATAGPRRVELDLDSSRHCAVVLWCLSLQTVTTLCRLKLRLLVPKLLREQEPGGQTLLVALALLWNSLAGNDALVVLLSSASAAPLSAPDGKRK